MANNDSYRTYYVHVLTGTIYRDRPHQSGIGDVTSFLEVGTGNWVSVTEQPKTLALRLIPYKMLKNYGLIKSTKQQRAKKKRNPSQTIGTDGQI